MLSDYSNGPALTPTPKDQARAAVAARSQSPPPVRHCETWLGKRGNWLSWARQQLEQL